MNTDLTYRNLKTPEEERKYREFCHLCWSNGNDYSKFKWPHKDLKREWMKGLFTKEGVMKGGAHLIPMQIKFRGVEFSARGLAGLAIPSQFRNKNYSFDLIGGMFKECIMNKVAFMVGFPFKYSFYDNIKASLVEEMQLLRFRPCDVKKRRTTYYVDEVRDMKIIKELYNERIKTIDYTCVRGEFEWLKAEEKCFKYIVYDKEDKPKGYVLIQFTTKDSSMHRSIRSIFTGKDLHRGLFIKEMFWLDAEAKQEVFNFIYSFRDQRDNVMAYVPKWENVSLFLTNYHHVWKVMRSKTMVKIINYTLLLSQLKYPKDKKCTITVLLSDKYNYWNAGMYEIAIADGKSTVKFTKMKEVPKDVKCDIVTDCVPFAQMLSGFMDVKDLLEVNAFEVKKDKIEDIAAVWPKQNNFFAEVF